KTPLSGIRLVLVCLSIFARRVGDVVAEDAAVEVLTALLSLHNLPLKLVRHAIADAAGNGADSLLPDVHGDVQVPARVIPRVDVPFTVVQNPRAAFGLRRVPLIAHRLVLLGRQVAAPAVRALDVALAAELFVCAVAALLRNLSGADDSLSAERYRRIK